ncbi:hypothetical protein GOODEAATRI_004721, partial [Goodea atripinnis]
MFASTQPAHSTVSQRWCAEMVTVGMLLATVSVPSLPLSPSNPFSRPTDVDECLITNVCGKHICVNLDGSYRCECRAGYRFSNTTEVCEDVNECLTGHHNCAVGQIFTALPSYEHWQVYHALLLV